MKKVLITIKNLSIKFGKKCILENLNFELYENTLVSLLGVSGSGKTSLINAIIGLLKPSSGEINFDNKSLKNNLGYVFQDSLLYEDITVYKNIYLSVKNSYDWTSIKQIELINNFLKKHCINNKEIQKCFTEFQNQYKAQVEKWKLKILLWKLFFLILKYVKLKTSIQFLKTINLNKEIKKAIYDLAINLEIENILKNKANQISGGQKQRVAIAKALIKNSKIIFMDEPFSSLDTNIKIKARDWLKDLQKKYKLTIVLVTHDQNDAIEISDYIIYLAKKTIQQYASPKKIIEQPYNLNIAKFIGYPQINFLKKENNLSYYIRPKNLRIIKSNSGEYVVTRIINTNNFAIYEITNNSAKQKLRGYSQNNDLKMDDSVKIEFDSKNLIKFNENEQNIFYKAKS